MDAGKKTTVLITDNFKKSKIPAAKLKKMMETVCRRFNISGATISILIAADAEIRKINKKFLGHSGTTDCISFNLSDEKGSSKVFDLVVNGQMAKRQARLRGHSAEAELALYVTHSLLHNIGFNDLRPKDAKKMHKMEDEILQQFGYGCVYNNQANVR